MSSRLYERIKTQLDSLRKEGTYKEYQYLVSSVGGRSTIEKYGDVVIARIQVSDALTYDDIDYSIEVLKRVLRE